MDNWTIRLLIWTAVAVGGAVYFYSNPNFTTLYVFLVFTVGLFAERPYGKGAIILTVLLFPISIILFFAISLALCFGGPPSACPGGLL